MQNHHHNQTSPVSEIFLHSISHRLAAFVPLSFALRLPA